jgi:hypothetical protein
MCEGDFSAEGGTFAIAFAAAVRRGAEGRLRHLLGRFAAQAHLFAPEIE